MAQVLALILAVGFLLIIFRLASGLLDPASRGPVMLLLNGPFSIGFWGFEVGLMSVLPIYVFIWAAEKKSLNGVLTGALMVLIGTFVMRYEFVVAGTGLSQYPTRPAILLADNNGGICYRRCNRRLFAGLHPGRPVSVVEGREISPGNLTEKPPAPDYGDWKGGIMKTGLWFKFVLILLLAIAVANCGPRFRRS